MTSGLQPNTLASYKNTAAWATLIVSIFSSQVTPNPRNAWVSASRNTLTSSLHLPFSSHYPSLQALYNPGKESFLLPLPIQDRQGPPLGLLAFSLGLVKTGNSICKRGV